MNGINQMIAQGVRMPQIESPINQLAQVEQIRQAQQTNALRQAQMREIERETLSKNVLNKAYADALSPTGDIDTSKLMQNLATSGQGSKIFEVRKSLLETDKAKEELEKVRFEQFERRVGFYTDEIANLKSSLEGQEWVRQLLSDPIVKRTYDQRGITEDQLIAQVPTDPAQFEQWKQQRALGAKKFVEMNKPQFIEAGGARVPVSGLTGQPLTGVPAVEQQPLPPAVEAQKSRIARAGASQVNVSTEKAYGGQIAKMAAEQDIALADQAAAIPRNIAKVDEALDLLYNSDINTGLGAEVFNVMDKARAKFLADKDAGKRVEGTEYLDALLGSDVFPQISALGIGARGLDTPAEREFLRNVITGTIKLDKSTLIRMTEFRRQGLEDAAKVYNSKVEGGELNKYFEFTGRPKNKVEVPARPSRGASAAVAASPRAVEFLRQNDTPENRRFFDQKYGAGASRSALGR
jgi:hypothetical protein